MFLANPPALAWCLPQAAEVCTCSTVYLLRGSSLQGNSLPQHSLHQRQQGQQGQQRQQNLCSGACSTSFPSFFTDLAAFTVLSLTYFRSFLPIAVVQWGFLLFLDYAVTELLPPFLMDSALASSRYT